MRAVAMRRSPGGALKAVYSTDAPIPAPGPGEVRIRVHAASINPVDSKFDWWASLLPPVVPEPFILGVDAAGTVDAIGEGDAAGLAVGDRVVLHANMFRGHGTFAEYCLGFAAACARIPDSVSFSDAAALPCAGWTAMKALGAKMGLRAPATGAAVITSGNGGVGGFAIQIAAALGLSPIIATCSPSSAARVRALGASHTLDYANPDIVGAVREIVPEGANWIVDSVSDESATALLKALAIDGHLACIAGVATRGGPDDSFILGWTVHDICLGIPAYRSGRHSSLRDLGDALFALVTAGSVKAMVEHHVTLADVPGILSGTVTLRGGKVVVDIL